jgi:hypothetical protein
MKTPLRVLYCHCAYANVVPKATKEEVLRKLNESGIPFDAVPDLCELSAKKDPCLVELAGNGESPLAIAACYPRAVRWLFSAAGAKLPAEGVSILNMRTETPEAVVHELLNPTRSAEPQESTQG